MCVNPAHNVLALPVSIFIVSYALSISLVITCVLVVTVLCERHSHNRDDHA